MSERALCDFQRGAGWRARKRKHEYSEEVGERYKVMQVRGLRGSENLVCKRE